MKKFNIYRPQYGLGSWMDKNGGTIAKDAIMAGGITASVLTAGAAAPAIMAGASLVADQTGSALDKNYAQKQGNSLMQKQAQLNATQQWGNTQMKPQYNYMQPMATGGKLYPNGGNIVNYTG